MQAQDPRGARLAVRARTAGVTAADVDRALTEDRSLVVTWLNRGTLHLVRSEDYGWLHALTTPPLVTACARRLAQEGVSPAAAERGAAVVERALVEEGPLTRLELRARLDAARVPTAGQALVHLLFLATLRGICVRGPIAGREQAYVLVRDWLGEQAPVDRDAALAELARRYLAGHRPADDRDLARWAGLPLRDARAGLRAIGAKVAQPTEPAELPPPRLLGAFDPLLLGWRDRTPFVGPHDASIVGGGIFRPVALAGGRVVATWGLRGGRVELEPLERTTRRVAAALECDGRAVLDYLGLSATRGRAARSATGARRRAGRAASP